jgi:hypothetical protein
MRPLQEFPQWRGTQDGRPLIDHNEFMDFRKGVRRSDAPGILCHLPQARILANQVPRPGIRGRQSI